MGNSSYGCRMIEMYLQMLKAEQGRPGVLMRKRRAVRMQLQLLRLELLLLLLLMLMRSLLLRQLQLVKMLLLLELSLRPRLLRLLWRLLLCLRLLLVDTGMVWRHSPTATTGAIACQRWRSFPNTAAAATAWRLL